MNVGLGEVCDKEIISVLFADNTIFNTPFIVLGNKGIDKILYHEPKGEGDKHFVDVFSDNRRIRMFNMVSIEFEENK